MKFEIIKYEFITNDYILNSKYIHWSRIYEWEYVINQIKTYRPKSIHNTACGGLNSGDCLHLTFCNDITNLVSKSIHSDVWGRNNYIGIDNKPYDDNFIFYDILTKHNETYDFVLNISTLEHLPQNEVPNAFDNLYNQVNIGGHLILTFDYPDVDLKTINNLVNATPLNFENRILNKNGLSVVLLHLIKK